MPNLYELRDELIRIARQGAPATVTYGALMGQLDISFNQIGNLLGQISTSECLNRRPLLSAIAVNQQTGYPGGGFLGLPVGIPLAIARKPADFDNPLTSADIAFIEAEQQRVWTYLWL
jgi:hypothetical protein